MSSSIWKIDFKNKIITIASNLDSLEGLSDAIIFPSFFNKNTIKIETLLNNKQSKKLELDLGFNGLIIMPLEDFNSIDFNKKSTTRTFQYSTPASFKSIKSVEAFDSVKIGKNSYQTIIMSSKYAKNKLLGLLFF